MLLTRGLSWAVHYELAAAATAAAAAAAALPSPLASLCSSSRVQRAPALSRSSNTSLRLLEAADRLYTPSTASGTTANNLQQHQTHTHTHTHTQLTS